MISDRPVTGLCISSAFALVLSTSLPAQQFGQQRPIAQVSESPHCVAAADLDGDGDQDVLWGSLGQTTGLDRVAWNENLGGGVFAADVTIMSGVQDCRSVAASDLDGDGDLDVVAVSEWDGTLYRAENLGGGNFGPPVILDSSVANADCVAPSDFDGDGDQDLFVAASGTDSVSLFRNLGGGVFGSKEQVVSTAAAVSVVLVDMDLDGDPDAVFCGYTSRLVGWQENDGGSWTNTHTISQGGTVKPTDVFCEDLNGDNLPDVLCASQGDNRLVWFQNLGGGAWSLAHEIDSQLVGAFSVFAADFDSDGDVDVLACGRNGFLNWYENQGSGNFGAGEAVATGSESRNAIAADLDGDFDLDVLSAFEGSRAVYWTENLLDPDSDQDGVSDSVEVSLGTDPLDQDTDDDGLGDGEEFNQPRIDTRWLQGPNGDYYRLAPAATWSQSSAAARAQGYELTSVQDAAEAQWISDTFGEVSGGFWIGLADFSGSFEWSDGSPVTFTQWATGEPGTTFVAAYVGGPNATEPGYWYAEVAGSTSRMSVWESPGPDAPMTSTDPLNWDTDGDGLGDGQEDGLDAIFWNGDLDGDGNPDVGGTDPAYFVPDSDPLTTTDPLDLDSDDDGLADGDEDFDGDGARSLGETDASLPDSDLDGLTDGLELGLTVGTLDTDGNVFIADRDQATTTDPTLADTDSGGVPDGVEDQNRDGGVDTWETDPNLGADEALAFYVRDLVPGQRVRFEVYNAVPFQNVVPAYSLRGPGPTATTLGLAVDLTLPITVLAASLSDRDGRVSAVGPRVPAGVPLGIPVWLQAVEIPLSSTLPPRKSNSVLLPIGAN